MRLQRLKQLMQSEGLEALLALSPNSIFHVSRLALHAQRKTAPNHGSRLVEDVPSAAVITASGAIGLLLPWYEVGPANGLVVPYNPVTERPAERLAELLRTMGLLTARLGIEKRYITAAHMEELATRLPGVHFLGCDALFDAAIAIKTPEDVARLREAAQVTERVMFESVRDTRPGDTEKQLAGRLTVNVLNAGADGVYAVVVGGGPNSTHAHNRPCERQLEPGDLVRMDFGARFNGYASDVARTAVVSQPTQVQKDRWSLVWEIQRATIAQMRPGIALCELYEYARQKYSTAGAKLSFPHIGHSFSFGGHDNPMITPFTRTLLEPDMVFYVELLHLVEGEEMYHIEDLVLITASGPVLLSDAVPTQDLWVTEAGVSP